MLRTRLAEFFFPARSETWITILRVGLGLQITIYALSLWRDWNYLFAANNNGLISRDLTEEILSLESPLIPRLGWLAALGGHLGFTEEASLTFAWCCLVCSGVCLLVGFLSRPSAMAAWLVHLATRSSGGFIAYGVDHFITIGLFYLAIAPLPDSHSLDAWLRHRSSKMDPQRVGFHQRVLQVHLCLIYFFGGLAKCLGRGWWNGTSIWRVVTSPPFNVLSPELLMNWKFLFQLAGIFVCVIETGYPIFIWFKKTRLVWLICICTMHVMIALTMGLFLFSLIMITLNVAAFVPTYRRGFAQVPDY